MAHPTTTTDANSDPAANFDQPNSQEPRLIRIFDTTLRDGEQSPGASMNLAEKLEVAVVGDELVVRAGSRRRALILPRRIAPLPLKAARLENGLLTVSFGPPTEHVQGGS